MKAHFEEMLANKYSENVLAAKAMADKYIRITGKNVQ